MLAEECGAFLHALSGEAVKGLRLNRLKLKPGVIPGLPDDLTKVPWERDGRYYDASLPFGKHPYHEAGVYYIQEPSAMAQAAFLRFGDRLYLLPKDAPSLKGLRVLRPGLQLGSFRKNRFEPSHALALHLQSTDAVNIISFPSASPAINAYLNGQIYRPTVEVKEGECVHAEGVRILMRDLHAPWTLVLADEFPIGWSKFAGGVFKNHYPRGLRRNN